MKNKFFGSKLNSILLLVLIILMIIALFVMFKDKDKYLETFSKITTNQTILDVSAFDPVKFFSELRSSNYHVIDFISGGSIQGYAVVVQRSKDDIDNKRLNLGQTCGAGSDGGQPCIFVSSFFISSLEEGKKPISKPRIITTWLPEIDSNFDGYQNEELTKGSLSDIGGDYLIFQTRRRINCEEQIKKYRLDTFDNKVELLESGPMKDVCGY